MAERDEKMEETPVHDGISPIRDIDGACGTSKICRDRKYCICTP